MKEYKEKFIWSNFIEKLKKNDIKEYSYKYLADMIVDSSEEDINNGNNEEVMMPNYNSLYNCTFLEDNDMILDDQCIIDITINL